MSWRNISNGAASTGTGTDTLTREMSSQSNVYTNQFDMSPEAEAARAAAASEQSQIAAEVAARLPDQASRVAKDNDDQFKLDLGGGKKRTKKRTVRRKRTYKKSKRSSYKKSKRTSYKKSKRGGATAPITFVISKQIPNRPLFQFNLLPDLTGKDLYDKMNNLIVQNPGYLTSEEMLRPRKLAMADNGTLITYEDKLSKFHSPTDLILKISPPVVQV